MRRRDVIFVIMAALMTSCRARSLPGTVHYDMDEKQAVGTTVGRGLITDAELATFYSTDELSRLRFSLVRGLPPDLTSRYLAIDQQTGLLQVDNDWLLPCSMRLRHPVSRSHAPACLSLLPSLNDAAQL